jgi:ribosomal protein S12 methylthiotransferase accessory factor
MAAPMRHIPGVLAGTWITQVAAPAHELDRCDARDLVTAEPLALPADLCVRRAPERRNVEPAGALSAGVAAGADWEAAVLRAALELCERDAAAMWWLGGQIPKAFALEHPATVAGTQLLGALRQGAADRRTMLLDITTGLGVPAVAAMSLDRDGCGLACGLASRLEWAEAARAAILEMCQMELAAPLAAAKRAERGDEVLNKADRAHLSRAAFLAADCDLLQPRGVSMAETPVHADLPSFAGTLRERAIRLFAVDLTRPDIGVAAARVVSPDLQPYSADVISERLRECRTANGNRHLAAASISLF